MKRVVIKHDLSLETLGEWDDIQAVAESFRSFLEKAWEAESTARYPDHDALVSVVITNAIGFVPSPYRWDGSKYHDEETTFSTANELWEKWYRNNAEQF